MIKHLDNGRSISAAITGASAAIGRERAVHSAAAAGTVAAAGVYFYAAPAGDGGQING